MANKKIGCILARVSRPTQNLQSQIDDLLRIAEENGYSVPNQFIFGEKISGMNAGFKKSLNALLSALDNTKNNIEAIFIWEVTRLSRGAYDFVAELMQINTRNVPVYFFDMNIWTWDFEHNCLSKENCDKLIGASIYGRTEWEKISKRTKRGRDAVAKQGYYIGHVADGYIPVKTEEGKHKIIKVDDERKGVIKKIFDLYIEGYSTDEIANILNTEGIPTTSKYRYTSPYFNYKKTYMKAGGRDIEYDREETMWQGTQVAQIITNRWYIGERSYGGELYNIEPIISEVLFSEAEILRKERAANFRTNRVSKKHNYLLGGYIYCGKCGRKMYGHCTGQNNHYYCSSFDEGKKCGLQGVCKENVEAIVCEVVKMRAIGFLLSRKEDVAINFFKINTQEVNKTKERIRVLQDMVKGEEKEIQNLENRKNRLYSMLADGKDKKTIEAILDQDENKRTEHEKKIKDYLIDINKNQLRLKAGQDVDKIISNIENTKDFQTLRQLMERTINRIEVYNVDNSISIIRIVYLNDKEDLCIYSYPLLKNKFISLHFALPEVLPIHIDVATKSIIIDKGSIAFGKEGIYSSVIDEDNENGLTWHEGQIPIRDFVLNARKVIHLPFLYNYDRTLFEEDDERKSAQIAKYKEWRKKYNNGLPTTLPYVVHDGNYEEYLAQRKHLYNRKYKIKMNKRLNAEQKEEMLEEIDRELSLLKAKVKYLSRDEAVNKFKEERKN